MVCGKDKFILVFTDLKMHKESRLSKNSTYKNILHVKEGKNVF